MKRRRREDSEEIQLLNMQWVVESTFTFDSGGMEPGAVEDMSTDSER